MLSSREDYVRKAGDPTLSVVTHILQPFKTQPGDRSMMAYIVQIGSIQVLHYSCLTT